MELRALGHSFASVADCCRHQMLSYASLRPGGMMPHLGDHAACDLYLFFSGSWVWSDSSLPRAPTAKKAGSTHHLAALGKSVLRPD